MRRTRNLVALGGSAAALVAAMTLAPVGSAHAAETCAGAVATIVGTEGDDVLVGTDGPDVIVGLGGDDTILGLDGDDIICAGDGDDVVDGGDGDDLIFGGAGADRLRGGAGDDRLHGDDGDDDVRGGPGDDTITGGLGDDFLSGSRGLDCLDLDAPGGGAPRTVDDAVEVDLGEKKATGYAGDDTVELFECVIAGVGPDTVRGGPGPDRIVVPEVPWTVEDEAPPRDTFDGAGGVDTLEILSNADVDLAAGRYDDPRFPSASTRYGASLSGIENVTVQGGGRLLGDDQDNALIAGGVHGDEVVPVLVRGRGGDDLIVGGRGDDDLAGGPGHDRIRGRGGADTISGSGGNDLIWGGPGDDVLRGKGGADTISGSAGDDDIHGGKGPDRLRGKGGDDRIRGGKGRDRIWGGGGADECVSPSGPPLAKGC